MTRSTATPLVTRMAHQAGIALSDIRGTGVGGRITAADVRRTAGKTVARPRAAAPVRPRPHLQVQMNSYWSRARVPVTVDVYGLNPVAEDLKQVAPQQYAAALARSPLPTLFVTGDLPLFTASGMDPELLLQLPWVARHAAASASLSDANELFETYGAPTAETWDASLMAFCLDPAVVGYENRMRAWGGSDV